MKKNAIVSKILLDTLFGANMDTDLIVLIALTAALSFGIGHGMVGPLLAKKDIDASIITLIKHAVSFSLLFILGTLVMLLH